MKINFLLVISFLFTTSIIVSQNEFNQFDSQGKRHGVWKKTYEGSTQTRYEGEFNHGKEIGIFRYYCDDCGKAPVVTKTFNDQDNTAQVVYLTKKGKVISKGIMEGKNRIGEWVYYHKKSSGIMTKEFYVNGKLDGLKTTYYLNQKITEEIAYKLGIKEGINNYYSPEGVLLKKLFYKNDQLEGQAYYYDANGKVLIEGKYKNGKKNGLWKYYKTGKFLREETYPKKS